MLMLTQDARKSGQSEATVCQLAGSASRLHLPGATNCTGSGSIAQPPNRKRSNPNRKISHSARAPHATADHLRAFTLLELMLVLAIIAAIGAITFPAFNGVLNRQRLQASAEKVRLELDRARLMAMRTGQAQMFECAPGQGKFSVHPLTQQSDTTNSGEGAKVITQSGMIAETTENGALMAAEPNSLSGDVKELEEDITFVSCIVATDSRAYSVAQQAMSGQVSTTNVGQVIIFYPDGSTSNAEVRLQNPRGEVRAVRLRGLTGHVKVLTITNVSSAEGDKS